MRLSKLSLITVVQQRGERRSINSSRLAETHVVAFCLLLLNPSVQVGISSVQVSSLAPMASRIR